MLKDESFFGIEQKLSLKNQTDKDRFLRINDLLAEYSLGNFDAQGEISEEKDEIDAVVKSINLLGEELKERTISRNYFVNIFNSTNEMIFVLDENGFIQNTNASVEKITGMNYLDLSNVHLGDILSEKKVIDRFNKSIKQGKIDPNNQCDCTLIINKILIPAKCKLTELNNESDTLVGFLFFAEDNRERVETEQVILRTIVSTQEKEQERLASDLHDSLGQELSAVKLFLTSLDENKNIDSEQISGIIQTCKNLLDKSISNLRSICYDLFPGSLENEGVLPALEELTKKLNNQTLIQFHYLYDDSIIINPTLGKNIFRIVQEFINNSLKYSSANNIQIECSKHLDGVEFLLKDDGKGFDIKNQKKSGKGIHNMKNRTMAFDGSFRLKSTPGKGTDLRLFFPSHVLLNNND